LPNYGKSIARSPAQDFWTTKKKNQRAEKKRKGLGKLLRSQRVGPGRYATPSQTSLSRMKKSSTNSEGERGKAKEKKLQPNLRSAQTVSALFTRLRLVGRGNDLKKKKKRTLQEKTGSKKGECTKRNWTRPRSKRRVNLNRDAEKSPHEVQKRFQTV